MVTARSTIAGMLLLASFFLSAAGLAQTASNQQLTPVRVQLQWSDQAQFAGFYAAKARQLFKAEGLDVQLIPGGPGINPIRTLQSGNADVAVAWLNSAWLQSTAENRVTNIAQIFSESALVLICRISLGIYTPSDVLGKQIGVWNVGDEIAVRGLLERFNLDPSQIELVEQRPGGQDLIEGKLPCVTAMTYNEYWSILKAGVDITDLIVVDPDDYDIPHFEDGLYVLTKRLESPEFRQTMVKLLRALRRGWSLSQQAPTLAIEAVIQRNPTLNRDHQQHMIQNVSQLVDTRPDAFGLFSLGEFDVVAASKRLYTNTVPPPQLWTHQVWSALQNQEGRIRTIEVSTQHYLQKVTATTAFNVLMIFGMLTFALSGVLEAINRSYDLWGRLVLAFLGGLGGGTLRDLLISGDRWPPAYLQNLIPATGILLIVILASVVTAFYRDVHKTEAFKTIKMYADIIGFSVLAIAGASFAISSGLPWFWAPICAALSCAGGGFLRDIVVNQEPSTFKGVFYEEVAILGALVFSFGLMIANHFEHSKTPVLVTIVLSILFIAACRIVIYRYNLHYPRWLVGKRPGDAA
ncbi:MAG: ABC transporter substrate-binding protein [Burkholderiaceae bacterium]|nr:ABC transporter substrate-binding protein [Burkholderiaceae bacterium]MCD8536197.1 ABC transporter substrate-binding protein [Burkholderiaceae bacterium]MCD8564828.1 ABC transporter substrate-binding protein [Burkholderiaceae bacterium]